MFPDPPLFINIQFAQINTMGMNRPPYHNRFRGVFRSDGFHRMIAQGKAIV